ncbi:hypothetical protein [Novosphingobium aquae]|uniref:LVIVD repeat-containing protein n=1 Tax=Novosphingobium aquae TaxID=3133435 RepID=A0ABU8SCQ4_9SPHN
MVALATASAGLATSAKDRPEPGLQGQTMQGEAVVLAQPYAKGLRRIGHDSIRGRDTNVQLAWVDHCAYVSSTAGPFPIIGTLKGDPALTGVAVIDVSNPRKPKTVKLLRDRGSAASLEVLHAVTAKGRKVLIAGAYHGGAHAAGTSGAKEHDPAAQGAWLDVYDVSDCANPKLMSEVEWPENSHSARLSPDGRLVYGTNLSPFTGSGGIQVMDISDLAKPHFLGKFGATKADGSTFEFASHEVSFSPDGRRMYAGVNASLGGDLNIGIKLLPPSQKSLGPDGGGVYIFDNTDFVEGRADPKLRLLGTMPGGGWHSVVPARIGGVNYLVGGAELGACPGTWPRITNIADEKRPFLAGEFKLAMNQQANCPVPTAADRASGGIVPPPGTATLHYNAVDSPVDTKLGLFNFMWGGLRVVDLRKPAQPQEVAYFKPGDVCTGHVRFLPESGQIWVVCNASGFHVLELSPRVRAEMRRQPRKSL